MPPKKAGLDTFLRKQVLQNKIKGPLPPRKGPSAFDLLKRASYIPSSLSSLFGTESTASGSIVDSKSGSGSVSRHDDGRDDGEEDLFSLFNERVESPKTKEELRQEKLKQFLAQEGIPSKKRESCECQELQALREELASLVALEERANVGEKRSIRAQRAKVISEIGALEAEQRKAEIERRRVELDLFLPPPIGLAERKKLLIAARKAQHAKVGGEKNPQKRQREDPDLDLDGEERLRLGKSLKKPTANITGHWQKTIHDYFPDTDDNREQSAWFHSLTREEKVLLRKELAELGKKQAMIHRKKNPRVAKSDDGW